MERVLRERPSTKLALPRWVPSTKATKLIVKKAGAKKKAKSWSHEDLVATIDYYDVGYKLGECCKTFNIPKSSFRDYLSRRTKSRKIGTKTIPTKHEDVIIEYMDEMIEVEQPLTPQMLKMKVAEIC